MKKQQSIHNVWTHALAEVDEDRQKCLAGAWKGLVWPYLAKDSPPEIPIDVLFDAKHKVIVGEMSFLSPNKSRGKIENVMSGGFMSDNDLRFGYKKKTRGIIGWGELLLKLSPDARSLAGRIVGVSSHTGEHFYSEVLLIKGKRANLRSFSRIRKPVIFIGHGRNKEWKKLAHFLTRKGDRVETYESGPRAGRWINDVLKDMAASASIAFLIMTGEDKTKEGKMRARQNVVHEIGLFQGKLGQLRAIVLLEEGVEPFSNLSGINYIPFKAGAIGSTFGEVAATIKREFPHVK